MKKLLIVTAAMLMSACSSVSIDRQVGELNAEIHFGDNQPERAEQVALVSSQVELSAFSQMQTALELAEVDGVKLSKDKVQQKYTEDMAELLDENFTSLMVFHGFAVEGPFDEALKEKVRQASYVVLQPELDLQVGRSDITFTRNRDFVSEAGFVEVAGQVTVSLIEPLTGEAVLKRSLDLSEFDISYPYLLERKTRDEDQFWFYALEGSDANNPLPDVLIQSYDKAYADAINQLYQQLFDEMNYLLSRRQLLSLAADVDGLKISTLK